MYAIEFFTTIKNGIIEIPKEYRKRLQNESVDENVRVILLTREHAVIDTSGSDSDFIEHLLANPLKIANFKPLNRDELHGRS